MLDNFREWLSDNLRYILLGLAVILVLVIAFFAVRLVTGLGSPKKDTPQTERTTEQTPETQTEARTSVSLERNQADVLEFVTQYYNAVLDKDYDTLTSLSESLDEQDRAEIESSNAAVESISNMMTYSKPGKTDGSYVVYIYFDAKLTGIETAAPCLRELYLVKNEAGNFVVADKTNNSELKEYIESLRTDSDVQALMNDVSQKMADAEAQDEDLKTYVESVSNTGESDAGDGADPDNADGDGDPVVGTSTGTMQANDGVYVRSMASTDGTIYGGLTAGMTVEVIENLDSGWSKIQYIDSNGNTVEGYVMTQYLSPAD